MKFSRVLLAAACAAALPVWAQTAPQPAPTDSAAASAQAAARPPIAPEKLQAMRQALLARIAVYDAVEQSYRAPTAGEQAALARQGGSSAAPRAVSLAGGGTAIKADPAEASFLVVDVLPDGKTSIRHAQSAKERATTAAGPTAAKPAVASRSQAGGQHVQ